MLGDSIQMIDSSLTGIDLLEHVSAGYAAKGLQLPYVPDQLVASMQQLDSEYFFASAASLPLPLDFIPAWTRAIVAPENDEQQQLVNRDYLFFGEAGYGVNSYFYYYFLHTGSAYLFYSHPYGGIYLDNESAAARINADQELIAQAFAQPRAGAQADAAVVIVADGKAKRYGWGTLPTAGDGAGDGAIDGNWHDVALADALKAVSAG